MNFLKYFAVHLLSLSLQQKTFIIKKTLQIERSVRVIKNFSFVFSLWELSILLRRSINQFILLLLLLLFFRSMFHADRKAHSSKCMVIKKCRFLSKVHTSNILQWREFTGVSPGNFEKGTEPGDGPPVQSRGKAPVRGPSDDIPPQKKAEPKCENGDYSF